MSSTNHPEISPEKEAAADLIAQLAHRDQVDKAGKSYIDHPRRVAAIVRANGYDRSYCTVALLHDVVEDTEVTQDDLRAVFGAAISEAVDNLTRREAEPSEDYYARLLLSDLSLVVKHADIQDNTSPERLAALNPATQERLSVKYSNAIAQLGGPRLQVQG
ncbi:HD domain-containing protein [Nesterenkonia sp. CF4.4]|uniref:HD domain-containing protein n=1 Tax=Nesterenkonia sp. CF4.4 TaxID=3373079 RepID=UPI003EE79552